MFQRGFPYVSESFYLFSGGGSALVLVWSCAIHPQSEIATCKRSVKSLVGGFSEGGGLAVYWQGCIKPDINCVHHGGKSSNNFLVPPPPPHDFGGAIGKHWMANVLSALFRGAGGVSLTRIEISVFSEGFLVFQVVYLIGPTTFAASRPLPICYR